MPASDTNLLYVGGRWGGRKSGKFYYYICVAYSAHNGAEVQGLILKSLQIFIASDAAEAFNKKWDFIFGRQRDGVLLNSPFLVRFERNAHCRENYCISWRVCCFLYFPN